ncbi:hypothetical protein [uncultured Enterovirga sp.]|uniref:hypothetical protein n=1 Tax=uncultured Enterovirga sp. TaxID=2026352 RepID=UPI0035CC7F83
MRPQANCFTLWPSPWSKKDNGLLSLGETLPRGLYALVWRISSNDQVWLCIMSGLIAVLNTVPIEIQRRVVDHSLKEASFRALALFVAAYACAVLLQGALKLLFNVYRSWVSEHAVQGIRSLINRSDCNEVPVASAKAAGEGTTISMIVAESEPIGGFVGESISEPLLQGGIMIGVTGYFVFLQPLMSLVIAAVYLPQFVFVPLMQRAITKRAQARIATLRSPARRSSGRQTDTAEGRSRTLGSRASSS